MQTCVTRSIDINEICFDVGQLERFFLFKYNQCFPSRAFLKNENFISPFWESEE